MIHNAIVHLLNDLPILVDLEALPTSGDVSVRCTNVRTVDGKRPAFVHDMHATFVFPLSVIRLIEAPIAAAEGTEPTSDQAAPEPEAPEMQDDEPDEDLLERIRSV